MSEQQRSAGAQEAARCINIGCDCDHCNEWKAKVVDRLAVQPAVAELRARVEELERQLHLCATNTAAADLAQDNEFLKAKIERLESNG